MASVVIAGNTSGSVTLDAPAVAGTTTLTLPTNTGNIPVVSGTGTSGQVLTSGGSGAVSTWSTISSGGMTLLGTLTMTSGTSQTLSGLTLTNYKQVQIVGSGVSTTFVGGQAGTVLLSPNSVRLANDGGAGSDTLDFFAFVDLATGVCTSSYVFNSGTPVSPYVRNSGLLASATSITLSAGNSTSYDAGTVKIYGVA